MFADVVLELNRWLAGAAVAAHNARFDLAFLRAEYRRAGWAMPFVPALCTLEASEYHLPQLERRRLGDCCWAVGSPLTGAHTALGDARATAALLAAFMNPQLGLPPVPQHLTLPTEALKVPWPSRATTTPQSLPSAPSSRRQLPPRVLAQIRANALREPAPPLVQMVERFSLLDALDEGAPAGSITYLEKLAEVLEDGEITADETADLAAVAEAMSLSTDDIAAANRAFVLALAHAALDDGKVTRAERIELQNVSEILQVSAKLIPALLDNAEHARHVRLSVGLQPLPENWPHGEPLRVGDKVVFTGCDDQIRTTLEQRSQELGVRIIGAVSPKVAMLVTDGSFHGTKASKASELGTRTVHPDTYAVLLKSLQPARPRTVKPLPTSLPMKSPPAPELSDVAREVSPIGMAPRVIPAQVRQWGRDNGWKLGVRGRIPEPLLDAYRAAHPELSEESSPCAAK